MNAQNAFYALQFPRHLVLLELIKVDAYLEEKNFVETPEMIIIETKITEHVNDLPSSTAFIFED